jgi:perosamine synthetase
VVGVHFAGLPLRVEELAERLGGRGVALIEDAAHAFPSRVGAGRRVAGTVGRAGAYSFYATKTITTGEGGMLVTDDAALAARARMLALHGISRDAWNRYGQGGSWFYEVEEAGFKYNLTDLAAALGLVQLARAEDLLRERRALADRYRELLLASPVADLVELPRDGAPGEHAWHLFVIRLHLDRIATTRDAVITSLADQGIGTSVHFIPLHRHPLYRRLGWRDESFPVATREFARVISLPLWPGMTPDDVARVVDALGRALTPA